MLSVVRTPSRGTSNFFDYYFFIFFSSAWVFLILTSISNLLSRIGPKFCSFLPFIYAPFYLIISIYTLEFSTRWPFIFHIFMIYLLYMIWGYLTALTHLCLTSVLTSTLHLNKYSSLLTIVLGSCNAIFNLVKLTKAESELLENLSGSHSGLRWELETEPHKV